MYVEKREKVKAAAISIETGSALGLAQDGATENAMKLQCLNINSCFYGTVILDCSNFFVFTFQPYRHAVLDFRHV